MTAKEVLLVGTQKSAIWRRAPLRRGTEKELEADRAGNEKWKKVGVLVQVNGSGQEERRGADLGFHGPAVGASKSAKKGVVALLEKQESSDMRGWKRNRAMKGK